MQPRDLFVATNNANIKMNPLCPLDVTEADH